MKKTTGFILTEMIFAALLVCGCSAGRQEVGNTPESGTDAPIVSASSGLSGTTGLSASSEASTASGPSAVPESPTAPASSARPELPSTSGASTATEPSAIPGPVPAPGLSDENAQGADLVIAPDLNRNGIAEEVRLTEDGEGQRLEIWENGEMIKEEVGNFSHAGWNSVFLCTIEGEDYLLHYKPEMYQGVCSYSYRLNTLQDNRENNVQTGSVDFDINIGFPIHTDFDPEVVSAFMDEINGLLSHSVLLLNTHEDLRATFEKEGRLYDSLWWLDSWEPVFSRDENKSLLDNLVDFQAAMSADSAAAASAPAAAQEDGLPITESLDMSFYSGAGAWANDLTLEPDGSFSGEYYDADCLTVYVCKYHGRFGEVEKLSDASWLLTLEELELDTGRGVGEEWHEGEYHYISSEPYGLDGTDAAASKPGAQFILYSPDAAGHQPGTELYGAREFQSWMHERREFQEAGDILGCWGLHNLATGEGFFTDADI